MQQLGNDIWVVRKEFRAALFGNIGGCSTIIRYASNDLMIISPVRFSDQDVTDIQRLGKVRYLLAPNALHHLYIKTAQAQFPDSKIGGPIEVESKRADIDFDVVLNEESMLTWEPTVSLIRIKATKPLYGEMVFFHHPSRTLVVTDLMFNVQHPGSWFNQLAMKLNGADRKFTMSRLGKLAYEKTSLREALLKIYSLTPENVIVAHGEPVLGEATPKIKESFSWLQ
jgi:hypothetical protein